MLDVLLEDYPREVRLPKGFQCHLRPLQSTDEEAFWQFFQAIPERERMFIKHRVYEREVIASWCSKIDLGLKLPLLALGDGQITGVCTLHQQLGGWKRHIGRISLLTHPEFRGMGLGQTMLTEAIGIAQQIGLEKLEAEFIADQQRAIKVFAHAGFVELFRLVQYVRDMQAISHDYLLLGLDLTTDEEYAGVG